MIEGRESEHYALSLYLYRCEAQIMINKERNLVDLSYFQSDKMIILS